MVARDGIEPPTPAFSGLRSAIREDVSQGFARMLDQENSEPGSLIVVPALRRSRKMTQACFAKLTQALVTAPK